MTADLEADGFTLLRGVFPPADVAAMLAEWGAACRRNPDDPAILASGGGPAYGARNVLALWPGALDWVRKSGLAEVLAAVVGPGGGVVRGLFFDKPPGHSWALPWHRDYNVAVEAHGRLGVFTKPTTKAGVPHVEAPESLLARMVTARIHLDPMTADNGPLRVVPGSHVLSAEPRPPETVFSAAGDVLLMRPLLNHSSGHSRPDTPLHRRILHVECAPGGELPDGYRWHGFWGLAGPPGGHPPGAT